MDIDRPHAIRLLQRAYTIGPKTAEKVLDAFDGDFGRVLAASEAELEAVDGVGSRRAYFLRRHLSVLDALGVGSGEGDEVEGILTRHQLLRDLDDLRELVDRVGECVLSVYWETGGGLGAGSYEVYRLADTFLHAPDPFIEGWTGPHDTFEQAAQGIVYFNSATKRVSCAYPIEDWIHVAAIHSPESGELEQGVTVKIDGRDWTLEELRRLRERVIENGALDGGPPADTGDLDLEACQAVILDGYRRGILDLDMGMFVDLMEKVLFGEDW